MDMKELGAWVVTTVGAVVFLCWVASSAKSCNSSDNETYKACIQSQRTAMECALILRGTK